MSKQLLILKLINNNLQLERYNWDKISERLPNRSLQSEDIGFWTNPFADYITSKESFANELPTWEIVNGVVHVYGFSLKEVARRMRYVIQAKNFMPEKFNTLNGSVLTHAYITDGYFIK